MHVLANALFGLAAAQEARAGSRTFGLSERDRRSERRKLLRWLSDGRADFSKGSSKFSRRWPVIRTKCRPLGHLWSVAKCRASPTRLEVWSELSQGQEQGIDHGVSVTTMDESETPSRRRFAAPLPSGKWRAVNRDASARLASSGRRLQIQVRNPASTCPTGIRHKRRLKMRRTRSSCPLAPDQSGFSADRYRSTAYRARSTSPRSGWLYQIEVGIGFDPEDFKTWSACAGAGQ